MKSFYRGFAAILAVAVLAAEVSATARELAEAAPSPLTPTPAIVGGVAAPQGRLPYMALIYDIPNPNPGTGSATTNCGGVLVRGNIVLTSASCLRIKFGITSDSIAGQPPPVTSGGVGLNVVAGAYYLDKPNDPSWVQGAIPVKELYLNPDFRRNGPYTYTQFGFSISYQPNWNDAAILVLSFCPTLSATVAAIPFATQAELDGAGTMLFAGWGSTSVGSDSDGEGGNYPLSGALQVGVGSRVANSACQPLQDACSSIMGSTNIILDISCPDNVNSLCVGGTTRDPTNPQNPPNQSPCDFDDGGPLVLNKGSASTPLNGAAANDRLVGLISYGIGCGLNGLPYVFTNMASPRMTDWYKAKLAQIADPCPAAPPPPPPSNNSTSPPPPAVTGALAQFAKSSISKPWAGKPKLRKVPKGTSDATTFCAETCLNRACAGFSVVNKGNRGVKQCAVFATVSTVCGDGQRAPPICRRVATGSYKKND